MFAVEKGVPLPESANKSKYPFADMEVGDSFAVTADKFKAAAASGYDFARQNKAKNIKFHFSEKHLRIWRVQ